MNYDFRIQLHAIALWRRAQSTMNSPPPPPPPPPSNPLEYDFGVPFFLCQTDGADPKAFSRPHFARRSLRIAASPVTFFAFGAFQLFHQQVTLPMGHQGELGKLDEPENN